MFLEPVLRRVFVGRCADGVGLDGHPAAAAEDLEVVSDAQGVVGPLDRLADVGAEVGFVVNAAGHKRDTPAADELAEEDHSALSGGLLADVEPQVDLREVDQAGSMIG